MEKELFEQKKILYFGTSTPQEVVAFSTTRIYAVSYSALSDKYTMDEYCKVILHEAVHVLQLITTRIAPEESVWLYEAVACYLTGQAADKPRKEKILSWEAVKQNFYAVPECYGIAYHLGKALLSSCPSRDIVALCADVPRCEAICAGAYAALFK